MSEKEELLRSLGLGVDEAAEDDCNLQIQEEGVEDIALPSPTVFDFGDNAWGLRQGEEIYNRSEALPKGNSTDEEYERAWHTVADFHAACYELDPARAEGKCTDELREQFITDLLQTPEFQALRESTMLSPTAAEVASVSLTGRFGKYAEEERKRQEEAQKGGGGGGSGGSKNPEREQLKRDIARMRAVGSAVKEAEVGVQEAKDAEDAFGIGGDGGNDGGRCDAKKLAAFHRKIKNSTALREIFKYAGRFRRFMYGKQRLKDCHGQDDVVGVVLDGEVGRLLPHELAKLTLGEELELDLLRRLVERQTQCREHKGVEKVAKGPIVVTVDESGSMSGAKLYTAKGLALTLALLARQQKRWCALVGFSGGTEGTRLALPPGKWDQEKVCEWLEHFYSGGTTMDVPLQQVPEVYWPEFVAQGLQRGKTDLICITDGQVYIPEELRLSWMKWKAAEEVRMISLIIQDDPGDLRKVSDEVHRVNAISVDEEAIGRVLSI